MEKTDVELGNVQADNNRNHLPHISLKITFRYIIVFTHNMNDTYNAEKWIDCIKLIWFLSYIYSRKYSKEKKYSYKLKHSNLPFSVALWRISFRVQLVHFERITTSHAVVSFPRTPPCLQLSIQNTSLEMPEIV